MKKQTKTKTGRSGGVTLHSVVAAWLLLIIIFLMALFGGHFAIEKVRESRQTPDVPPGETDSAVMIRVKDGETVQEMDLDTYLQGVVSAEMPAVFELEALKAQAVAARTETIYKMENGPVANHPDADICTDFRCCQAYKTMESAMDAWGSNGDEYSRKIALAVRSTDGQVILYEDKPILAVFFSAASGYTNGSGDVWVNDLPYLKSVESPEGEDHVPNYYSVVTIPVDEFKTKFLGAYPKANLEGAPSAWFGQEERSDSDMVRTITIGGVEVKGTKMRSLFQLRSASFRIAVENDSIVFRVTGYGHGVGMSQYGAHVMASQGKTYLDILQWYYTDVAVKPYTPQRQKAGG